MLEIEVKIKVPDLEGIGTKLEALGAKLFKARYFEENIMYDDPEKSLYAKQHALRLRTIQKKSYLTFKGPKQESRKFKIRPEFETEVKNNKHMKKILQALGFIPVFQYRKHRTVYKHKQLTICLDETPVGDYIELEGERSDIVKMASALGFSKNDFLKTDYIELMKKAGKIDQPEKSSR